MNTLHQKKREQIRQRSLALAIAILLVLLWGTLPARASAAEQEEAGTQRMVGGQTSAEEKSIDMASSTRKTSYDIAAKEGAPISYKDVPAGAWYASFVAELSEENILSGFPDKTFRPAAKVTCGQFLSMAMQAGELMEGQHAQAEAVDSAKKNDPKTVATGTAQKHWATDFYNAAVQSDVLIRNELPFTALDRDISREWMAVICSRILMQSEASNQENRSQKNPMPAMSDYGQMPSYASAIAAIRDIEESSAHSFEIVRAYQMKLLSGYPDGTFRPEESLSRAEAAAVISKLHQLKTQGAGNGQEASPQQPPAVQNPELSGLHTATTPTKEDKELPQGTDKEIPTRSSNNCWEKDPRDFPKGTIAFYYWLSKEDGAAADSAQGRELKACMEQQLSDKEAADQLFQAFTDFADKARGQREKGKQGLRKQYIGQKPVLMDSVKGVVSVYVRPQGTETQYWEVKQGQIFEEFF